MRLDRSATPVVGEAPSLDGARRRRIRRRLPLVLGFLLLGAGLRADERECARLQKQSEEIDQKISDASKKNDEAAVKRWVEERFKISKPLRKCTCDHLRRDKGNALDRAQNAPTARERLQASEEVVNINRILKELCGEENENAPYDPCWIEKYRADLARIVEKDSPENKKKAEEARKELCGCLKKHNLPLPAECEDAASTLFPGDKSICDRLKKDYDEKQKALQNAGSLKPAEIRKINEAANEAREKYCQCLTRMNVKPLPEDCQGVKTAAPAGPAGPSKVEPPPKASTAPPRPADKSPKVSPVPPVPGAPAPVPPPPSKTVVPAPTPPSPPSSAPPASSTPPASNTSTYVCGRSPCDCSKQSPRKVCKPDSGCVCTKG